MSRYKVVVAGLGKRGRHHAQAFFRNPRFELVGLATRDPRKLTQAATEFPQVRTSTSVAELLQEARPDVFCFCTPPEIRKPMIELGLQARVSLIAYEKPMALSMRETIEIQKLIVAAGVKTVVSHQHRYGAHYQKVKEIIQSGDLGRVHTLYAHGAGWMMHLLTHLIDYLRWFNGGAAAKWVMAQAAGRGKLSDAHPSPDYIAGFIHFSNDVRGIVECGAGAPDVPEVDYWWRKNRIGAIGTDGFAEVLTGSGWRAVTRKGCLAGPGCMDYELDMAPYIDGIADWLDDASNIHPCNGESGYAGFEIAMGMVRSAVNGGQVALPLSDDEPEIDALRRRLGDRPLIATTAHRQYYL